MARGPQTNRDTEITCSQDLEAPPPRRKFYRRDDDSAGLGVVFGEDSEDGEEEGDHESSYDGPPSDVDEELDWEREVEETQLEGQMPLGHEMEAESRELYSGVLEEMYADAPYNVPGGDP